MNIDHRESAAIAPLRLEPLPGRPLVSVLIANYNYGRYLGQAIDSVVSQSYQESEVIVCDDGSTDGSVEVANVWAKRDPRVTVLRQDNAGQARALHAAYQRSRGEIICLLDADDEYLPSKLETLVDAYRANPQVGFIVDRVIRVDMRGRQCGIIPLITPESVQWCGPMLLRTGVLRDLPPCSGLSLRRAIADEIFPLYEPASVHGYFTDRIMQRVAPLITPILRLSQPLTIYRLHGSNYHGWSNITVAMLERELRFGELASDVQRNYLTRRYPALASALVPADSELTSRYLYYMLARLTRERDVRQAHYRLLHHPAFRREPWVLQCFWASSILLPTPVFQRAIDLVMGAGYLKQIMARLTSP